MKDVNFFTAQIKLWTRIFDYKGKSTRKEYLFQFILHVIIGLLAIACIGSSAFSLIFTGYNFDWHIQGLAKIIHYAFLVVSIPLMAYLIISIIPWISLTVRRLRDAGKSGWWTVLLLVFGVGHIFLFFLCSLASTAVGIFNPIDNRPEAIYGPPEMFNVEDNEPTGVYGPPPFDLEQNQNDYNPEDNEQPDVYGPPLWEEDEFDPELNEEPAVYGPPPWADDEFDPDANEPSQVYGPPQFDDEFDPDANEPSQIYGPPQFDDEEPFEPYDNLQPTMYGPPDMFDN